MWCISAHNYGIDNHCEKNHNQKKLYRSSSGWYVISDGKKHIPNSGKLSILIIKLLPVII